MSSDEGEKNGVALAFLIFILCGAVSMAIDLDHFLDCPEKLFNYDWKKGIPTYEKFGPPLSGRKWHNMFMVTTISLTASIVTAASIHGRVIVSGLKGKVWAIISRLGKNSLEPFRKRR